MATVTNNLPADAVPAIPASKTRSYILAAAGVIASIGIVLQTVASNGPELVAAFPALHWLGGAVAGAGLLSTAILRVLEQNHVTIVNYSLPPTPTMAQPEASGANG